MSLTDEVLKGYDNSILYRYDCLPLPQLSLVGFDEIGEKGAEGVLKANFYRDGKLMQAYSRGESHVCVIAATGMGKTTGYVLPTIVSMSKRKRKSSMMLTDPKGEIYRLTSNLLEKEGYRVLLLNFRDQLHSEYWNPLTPIFRKYRRAMDMANEVTVEATADGFRNCFHGKIFDSQPNLDAAIDRERQLLLDEVAVDVNNFANMVITVENMRDPYWEQSAAEVLEAFIFAMLEDSEPDNENRITEDTFSLSTVFSVLANFKDGDETYYNDNGYFSERDKDSRAYLLAKNTILENAKVTRKCIMAVFATKMAPYRSVAVRQITSCNSFEIDSFVSSDKPIALFIDYRDEIKTSYEVISLFVQSLYTRLIECANKRPDGKFDIPFRFILDEFGNMPAIKDFETVISACRGRNIFFNLILQSYAQLNNVYGQNVADIIKDNLNIHIFMGSNNPATIKEFSGECGNLTRLSPLSALNGKNAQIDHFDKETIPLVPPSVLSALSEGECLVTEANCGYVLFSRLERYYRCKEITEGIKLASVENYRSSVDPLDSRYKYLYKSKPKKRTTRFDFDF